METKAHGTEKSYVAAVSNKRSKIQKLHLFVKQRLKEQVNGVIGEQNLGEILLYSNHTIKENKTLPYKI